MAGDRSSQGERDGGTVHFRQGRPGERESGRRRGCGRSEGGPRRRSTSRRRGRRSMRSFATSRPTRRRRRSSASWPISSTNTFPRSRIRRSSSSIRAVIFRRPRARASTGRNRLGGIESKEAGRRDAARFYFNLSGLHSPSLATKKRVMPVHQDTPLLAAGDSSGEGSSGSAPQGLFNRLQPQRQVVPGIVEIFQLHGNRFQLLIEALDPLRITVDVRFAEGRLAFPLPGLQKGDPLLGFCQVAFRADVAREIRFRSSASRRLSSLVFRLRSSGFPADSAFALRSCASADRAV